jgi:hypothetical protein
MPIFGYRGSNVRPVWGYDTSSAADPDYGGYGFETYSALTSVSTDTDDTNASGLSVLAAGEAADPDSEADLPDHLPSGDSNQDSSQESGQVQETAGSTETEASDNTGNNTQHTAQADSPQESPFSSESVIDQTAGGNQTDVEPLMLAFNLDEIKVYDLLAPNMQDWLPMDAGPQPSEIERRLAGGGVILFGDAELSLMSRLM